VHLQKVIGHLSVLKYRYLETLRVVTHLTSYDERFKSVPKLRSTFLARPSNRMADGKMRMRTADQYITPGTTDVKLKELKMIDEKVLVI